MRKFSVKRKICILAALCLLFAVTLFAACSKKQEDKSKENTSPDISSGDIAVPAEPTVAAGSKTLLIYMCGSVRILTSCFLLK